MRHIFKKDWLLVLLAPVFFIYLYNLSPGIFSADSGEMAASAKILGVPHPPGYPLYTVLAHFFLQLPFNLSPAGKIGLFSILTSIISLFFLYRILEKSLNNKIIAITAVLTLSFSYPFWLYSEVVEVFSLNNLIALILFYLAFLINQEKSRKKQANYCHFLAFSLGLSLTHHHTIILIFPALIFLIWPQIKLFKNKLLIVKCLMLFTLGFSPYLYVFWSARRNPAINWDNVINFNNFLTLFLRRDYGTFLFSAAGGFQSLNERLASIGTLFYFLLLDFGFLGVILGLIGFIKLFKDNRQFFWPIFLAFFFSGLFFAFYSAFPIIGSSFGLGVFERFIILPSIFWLIAIAWGILTVISLLKEIIARLKISKLFKITIILSELIFLILPLKLFLVNQKKLGLRNNYLVDNMAFDLLSSLPKNSLVFMTGDLFVFASQYVYYNLNLRQDVKLIPLGRLTQKYTRENLVRQYPDLDIPISEPDNTFADKFISLNKKKHPIFTVEKFPVEGEWSPYGFLFRYYDKEKIDKNKDQLIKEAETVFLNYHNVLKDRNIALNNFLFSDVFQMYALAHINTGKFFIENELYQKALNQFLKAKEIYSEAPEIYKNLGFVYSMLGKCNNAETEFRQYQKRTKDNLNYYFFLEKNAQDCFKDKKKTARYHQLYLKEKSKQETPLDKL